VVRPGDKHHSDGKVPAFSATLSRHGSSYLRVTLCFTVALLAANVPFALYRAVIVCVAADRELVVKLAVPLLNRTDPSDVLPSKNVTFPCGLPTLEVILAVKVTVWPTTEGLGADVRVVVVA